MDIAKKSLKRPKIHPKILEIESKLNSAIIRGYDVKIIADLRKELKEAKEKFK